MPIAPLLDLDTLTERPKIIIDKQLYEIRSADELSLVEHHRLRRQGERIEALMNAADLDDSGEAELERLVVQVSDFVMVDVPDEVRARLRQGQRLQVIEVFTRLPLQGALRAILARAAGASSIPETPSPASAASMVETLSPGSTTSRSPSSGPVLP